MSRRIVLIAFLLSFSNGDIFSQRDIGKELLLLADMYEGAIGVMAKNFSTGDSISVNAQRKFPSASIIKVPVMVEFFFQVSENRIDLQSMTSLTDSNKWGGSGVLQFFNGRNHIKLMDAVTLMIILSDNTATNLVIDALGATHQEKLDAVNQRMESLGLKNTRLLNKLMSWETKTDSPESIRYGVGVTTPQDMTLLFEKIYRLELPFSEQMLNILRNQQYDDMIPRLLPLMDGNITVAHKTGSVTDFRCDAGIIKSSKADYAIAIFCDESQDHRDSPDNMATLAAAKASRLIWNYFTDDLGFETSRRSEGMNWNSFPGGKWSKLKLKHAPFPQAERNTGYMTSGGDYFPFAGHYDDGSAIVIIPDGWHETKKGSNVIVHFHGHNNHVLNVLEQFNLPRQLIFSGKNAILILAQGPKDAPDSFGGKMEEADGLKDFIREILSVLKNENIVSSISIDNVVISAHSGGYRPAAFVLEKGGLTGQISDVFLFDAFYGQHDKFFRWIRNYRGRLISIYTAHLAEEHREFFKQLDAARIKYSTDLSKKERLIFYPTKVCHDCVMEENFGKYLELSHLKEIED